MRDDLLLTEHDQAFLTMLDDLEKDLAAADPEFAWLLTLMCQRDAILIPVNPQPARE